MQEEFKKLYVDLLNNMIRYIAIVFNSLALLIILSSAGLAHHHHKGSVHILVDSTDYTNCCTHNDTHLTHEDQSYSDCVLDKPYCSTSQHDVTLTKAITVLFTVPFFHFYHAHQLYEHNNSVRINKYRTYIFPDIPDYVSFSKGLRAPPTLRIS